MRTIRDVSIALMMLAAVSLIAQEKSKGAPAELLGTWSGSWESREQSGGFELTLETPKEGSAGGRVAVTGEPTYRAALKTLAFDGNKMTATYDFPPDDQIEIQLTATFEGNTAKGGWSARQKAGGNEEASGTWTGTRK